jgi:hypothetical protein
MVRHVAAARDELALRGPEGQRETVEEPQAALYLGCLEIAAVLLLGAALLDGLRQRDARRWLPDGRTRAPDG